MVARHQIRGFRPFQDFESDGGTRSTKFSETGYIRAQRHVFGSPRSEPDCGWFLEALSPLILLPVLPMLWSPRVWEAACCAFLASKNRRKSQISPRLLHGRCTLEQDLLLTRVCPKNDPIGEDEAAATAENAGSRRRAAANPAASINCD